MIDRVSKDKLRNIYKNKRRKISHQRLSHLSNIILEKLEQLDIWDYDYYHIFISIKKLKEINTANIIKYIWDKNKKVVIPKIEGDKLNSYLFEPNTILEKNRFGIYEPIKNLKPINPNSLNVIFVPLLCFDKKGYRVGYGGGYYDKFLSLSNKSLKIGLSLFNPIDLYIDINKFDIKWIIAFVVKEFINLYKKIYLYD